MLCLLRLVLGCELLPFLVIFVPLTLFRVSSFGAGVWVFLFFSTLMLFRDGCFGLFMTDRTQELRWTGATVDAVAFGSATVSW